MPSFPPRSEPIKKKNQLSQREMELAIAIRKNFEGDKLLKFVDKYRQSYLSILKAKLHLLREREFQKKPTSLKIQKTEDEIVAWTNKPTDTIIHDVKSKFANQQF